MGVGGISIWQLLIILVIVVLLFGTKKLRGMGGDLGSAIKSFKKAVKEDKGADSDGESPAPEASLRDQSGDAEPGAATPKKTSDEAGSSAGKHNC